MFREVSNLVGEFIYSHAGDGFRNTYVDDIDDAAYKAANAFRTQFAKEVRILNDDIALYNKRMDERRNAEEYRAVGLRRRGVHRRQLRRRGR